MFNKEKLEEAKKVKVYNYSKEALQALDDVIDLAIEQEGLRDLYDAYWEATDATFMYYSDAWDYMKQYGDNDMHCAFREGFTTITQVAAYNLKQEFFDLLSDVGLDSGDFEK